MKKLVSLALTLPLFAGTVLPVFAQTPTFTPGTIEGPMKTNGVRQELHQQLQQDRADFKTQQTEIKQQTKDQLQQARAEFQQKLSQIKDQRKQQITSQIDQKIQQVNQLRTTQMQQALTELSSIVDKLASKEATLQGGDTASVSALIASARSSIATAQQAVASQAAKSYVIQIASESALKSNVGTTLRSFTSDMKQTFKTVQEARKSVVEAARALARIKHEAVISSTPASESANQ